MSTILVVEDDLDLRSSLVDILEGEGFHTLEATSGREAMDKLESGAEVDLIVSDYLMKEGTGKDLLLYVRRRNPQSPPFFLITGESEVRPQEAKALGAQEFILKPFDVERFLRDLNRYLPSRAA